MNLSAEAWMLIGVALLAGFLVLIQCWRKAERTVAALRIEAAGNSLRSKKLAADLSKESRARRRQAEEFANLRKRVDKTKRRTTKGGNLPLGTASRIRDHEAEVERVGLDRDRANAARETLETAVVDLESRLAQSVRALAAATVPSLPPVSTNTDIALEKSKTDLAENREKVAALETELVSASKAEVRLRKRLSTQEILYASIRAELSIKTDRLRTQEEELQRLRALKVAIIDSSDGDD